MENRPGQSMLLNSNSPAMPLERKPNKRKRNSSALSYVAVIAHAILSSPRQRLPLSEIYQFIEERHPQFTENRARWKNTVRHNLSLHDCFVRGEVAFNKKGCNWRIHPGFVGEFSRGDFSRHKLSQLSSPSLEHRYESSYENPFPVGPVTSCSCYICGPAKLYLSSTALPQHFSGRGIQYMQLPQLPWNNWIF